MVNRSGARRQDLFISTKLRGADHGRRKTRAAVSASLDRLRLDYLDLYLIHWPLPRLGLFTESREAMLELAAEGLIRSAGVSNFKPAHVAALIEATGVAPAVDQIELSPALPRHRGHPQVRPPERQRANLQIFGSSLSDAEMTALAALDLGEDAAVGSDARVEF